MRRKKTRRDEYKIETNEEITKGGCLKRNNTEENKKKETEDMTPEDND